MKTFQTGIITVLLVPYLPGILTNSCAAEAEKPTPTLSTKLFSAMDANSDQLVSKEEYYSFGKAYMQEKGKAFNSSTAQQNFAALDINGDGSIGQDDARVKTIEEQEIPKGIVGVWRYWDEKKYGFITFVFAGDGEADMIADNVSTRAMALQHGGSMTYTYDPSTDPDSLDIIAVGGSGPETVMRCIVRFLDDDRIKLRMAHGKGYVRRPEGFTAEPEGDTLILKRSQHKPGEMRYF